MAEYYVLRGKWEQYKENWLYICLPFCIRFAFRQAVENWGTSCKFQLRIHGSMGTFCNMNITYISPLGLFVTAAEMPRTFEPSKRTGRVPYHITLSSTRLKDELVFFVQRTLAALRWPIFAFYLIQSVSFSHTNHRPVGISQKGSIRNNTKGLKWNIFYWTSISIRWKWVMA